MKICMFEECDAELNARQEKFCSRSHAATFNNKMFVKRARRARGKCLVCGENISTRRKYCDSECYAIARKNGNPIPHGDSKRCNACKEVKDISLFGVNRTTRDGLMYQCKECNTKRVREYNESRVTTPVRQAQWEKHGMSLVEYEALAEEQGRMCPICVTSFEDVKTSLCIDHDHSCCGGIYSCGKCVRGILCGECNRSLGLLRDDVDSLERAVVYLARMSAREAEGAPLTPEYLP